VIPDRSAKSLGGFIERVVTPGTTIITDDWSGYAKLGKRGYLHSASPQHLQAYLNEFTFRFNHRFYPFNALRSLLGIAGDVSTPTYAELYAKKLRPTTDSGLG
jgi:ISXO2-like transposase domain